MTVEIDPGVLVGLVIVAAVFPLLFMGLFIGRLRSPEFRLRLKRKKFVYAFLRDRIGALQQHVIPMDEISGSDGGFKLGKGMYFWRSSDKQGRQTAFPFRKTMACIYRFGWPTPEAFSSQSLSSIGYTAEDMERIIESRVEQNIVEAMKSRVNAATIFMAFLVLVTLAVTIYIAISLPHATVSAVTTTATHAGNQTIKGA